MLAWCWQPVLYCSSSPVSYNNSRIIFQPELFSKIKTSLCGTSKAFCSTVSLHSLPTTALSVLSWVVTGERFISLLRVWLVLICSKISCNPFSQFFTRFFSKGSIQVASQILFFSCLWFMIFLLTLTGGGMYRNNVNNLLLCHCLGQGLPKYHQLLSGETLAESTRTAISILLLWFASTTQRVRKSWTVVSSVTHPSIAISVAFWIKPCLGPPTSAKVYSFSQMPGSSQNGFLASSYSVCSWVPSFE